MTEVYRARDTRLWRDVAVRLEAVATEESALAVGRRAPTEPRAGGPSITGEFTISGNEAMKACPRVADIVAQS